MNNIDIARAMKDAAFRATLTSEELALLPANAAGVVELGDADLLAVSGGRPQTTHPTGSTYAGPCCAY